ncbi:MAG: GDP-mannose 4,6-dehydratase [Planctomycetes bacterium]|nr:GDP-mannose 4,6-dehydratase [Planctomycetota bacterium]
MAKILVTGGAGFVGSFVTRQLVQAGHDVVVLDAFVQYVSPFQSSYQFYLQKRFAGIEESFVMERGDTRDKLNLAQVIQRYRPERIVHLAGLPIADLSNRFPDETISTTVNSTVNILHIIKDLDFVKRFVLISSSMVYGDFRYEPADEDHPTQPKEVYGGTKLAAEVLTRSYGSRFGIPYTIIRPSAVYGPTDVNNRVSQQFIMNALAGTPLTLHDGGAAKLDFTYVADAAHGICLATFAEEAKNETFNITRGEGRSLREFVEILRRHFPNLRTQERKADVFRPQRGALDILKARSLLRFEPKYSLEAGIRAYLDYVVDNPPPDLGIKQPPEAIVESAESSRLAGRIARALEAVD